MPKDKQQKKNKIHDKHDMAFKKGMGDIRVAKEMIETYLPQKVLRHFDLMTLRISKETYIDGKYTQSSSGIVYGCKTKNNGQGYFYCLWEHQSSPDKHMMLRFLSYTCRIMQSHIRQGSKYLPIVIPALIYNGRRSPYPYSCDLFDGFADKTLATELMFKPAKLVDLSCKQDDEILQHKWSAFMQMLLKHMRARDLLPYLEKLQSKMQYLRQHDGEDILKEMLECIMLEGQAPDIDHFIKVVKPTEEGKKIVTIAEQFEQRGMANGIEQGMADGMASGIKQGMKRGIANGIEQGMADGMASGMKRGIANGIEQGMADGMASGIKQGMKHGANKMQIAIVKKMIQRKMNSAAIAELSDLTPAEINKIAAELEEKV